MEHGHRFLSFVPLINTACWLEGNGITDSVFAIPCAGCVFRSRVATSRSRRTPSGRQSAAAHTSFCRFPVCRQNDKIACRGSRPFAASAMSEPCVDQPIWATIFGYFCSYKSNGKRTSQRAESYHIPISTILFGTETPLLNIFLYITKKPAI